MRKRRFTEAQIVKQEAGLPAVGLCRKHGMSTATFYQLKAKYGWLEVSDTRRLRQLVDKNGKLKRLLADSMLDNAILKDLLEKSDDIGATAGRDAAGVARLRDIATPGLRADWCRSQDGSA